MGVFGLAGEEGQASSDLRGCAAYWWFGLSRVMGALGSFWWPLSAAWSVAEFNARLPGPPGALLLDR